MSRPSWNNLLPNDAKLILELLNEHKVALEEYIENEEWLLKRAKNQAEVVSKHITAWNEEIRQINHIKQQLQWIDETELTSNEWES